MVSVSSALAKSALLVLLVLAAPVGAKLGKVPGMEDAPSPDEAQAFTQADSDGSGDLSIDEYTKMLSATLSSVGEEGKIEGYEEHIAESFKGVDQDANGGICFKEWSSLVSQGKEKAAQAGRMREVAHDAKVRMSFDMSDGDKDGVLTQDEFFEGFSKYGYDKSQITAFFAKGNLDGDHTLTFEEFEHARSGNAQAEQDKRKGRLAEEEEQQRTEFKEADANLDGQLSSEEYLKVFMEFAKEMGGDDAIKAVTPEEILASYKSFDLDGNGGVSEQEWVDVLRANNARAAHSQRPARDL
mmetsp:Transcript_60799/g.144717  ORF Transcript_60799/g.144717 Transcript_60799/m.144717 type:complete len:298 (+) Transcript_60799:67-960(+)